MCEQCEQMDEMDRVIAEGEQFIADNAVPFYGQGVVEVIQQANDLDTLKRIRLLQAQVAHHQNMLRAGVESLFGMCAILTESASPLLVGGMPEWFTAATQDVSAGFSQAASVMTYMADRLEQDYTG